MKNKYKNPLTTENFCDPCILRDGEYYYLYATNSWCNFTKAPTAKFSPSPILRSKDLCNYEFVGSAFDEEHFPRWGTKDAGLWAPDIIKINGKYVFYYALSILFDPNASIGVAIGDSPAGPFVDQGPIIRSLDVGVNNSIDPTVFQGYDGKYYIIWGSYRGIYGSQLSDDGLKLVGEKVHIAGFDKGEIDLDTYEASYMVKRNGTYYLFFSMGKTLDGKESTYHVVSARSKNPLGPYFDTKGNDMFGANQGDLVLQGNPHFVGVGHCCVTTDDNNDYWIFYHGVEVSDKYPNGESERILAMDKILWDENATPHVKDYTASYHKVLDGPEIRINR